MPTLHGPRTAQLNIALLCMLFAAALSSFACSSAPLTQPGRPITDFKQLHVAEGDYAWGYHNLYLATKAADVVAKFGNPAKSEELSDYYKCKVFYYRAKDEFGNACLARLQFVPMTNCNTGLNCYGLVSISTEAS
jgi:hypothetical protein